MKYILIAILAFSGLILGITSSQAQQKMDLVTGVIVSVKPEERSITIKNETWKEEQVYQIPETMKILKKGREINLSEVRKGDVIEAKFIINNDVIILTNMELDDPENMDAEMTSTPTTNVSFDAGEQEVLPTALPKTASLLPLYTMIGFLLLFFAGVLRITRPKI